jgi:hypothetical protein
VQEIDVLAVGFDQIRFIDARDLDVGVGVIGGISGGGNRDIAG